MQLQVHIFQNIYVQNQANTEKSSWDIGIGVICVHQSAISYSAYCQ